MPEAKGAGLTLNLSAGMLRPHVEAWKVWPLGMELPVWHLERSPGGSVRNVPTCMLSKGKFMQVKDFLLY